jgi:cytochrome c biogenesis protein CcmG/thiol:disulfide interchange protein DsbE
MKEPGMNWRFAIPAMVAIALFGVFWFVLYRAGQGYNVGEIQSPLLGKAAPQFRLSQVEDATKFVDSKDYKGHPYVLNVWATWCSGCQQEHPVLLEIARQNLVPIVGLDTKDDLNEAQQWLTKLGDPYAATAFDGEGRVSIDWGVYGAPETFLIDGNGIVLYKHIAPLTMEVWEREFLPRIQASRGIAAAISPEPPR